ncbi:MAG: AAA family ATPase [Verrucomicrobia bacterium]|nr:AAA family ATPase [Verrucomicrobiota bacterium]
MEITAFEHRISRVLQASPLLVAVLVRAAQEGYSSVAIGAEMNIKEKGGLIEQRGRLYLPRYFQAEERGRQALRRLLVMPVKPLDLQEVGSLLGAQQQALEVMKNSPLLLLSGGPGTGKTFTAAQLVKAFQKGGGGQVALAAPTGKAAANLERALGGAVSVQTLHRLLRYRRQGPAMRLSADLILVDEASMIDLELFAALLEAVKEGARLVLMGDSDQLPPVEVGALFGRLVELPQLAPYTVRLDHCHRTDETGLLTLAASIRHGDVEGTLALLKELGWHKEPKWEKGVPVLSALREGPWGVQAVNALLHFRFGVEGEAVPIMILRNDPLTSLSNGEMGWLEGSKAYFGDKVFSVASLPSFEMAYCISIHKSQGSEFPSVTCLFPEGSERFGRELLYTAVTRAKKKIDVVGSEKVLRAMIEKKGERGGEFVINS